jgi:ankyrin repeat protein
VYHPSKHGSFLTNVDPPVEGHSHTTPLHQAAGGGHEEVARLLVKRGARLDLKDILWRATI